MKKRVGCRSEWCCQVEREPKVSTASSTVLEAKKDSHRLLRQPAESSRKECSDEWMA
jgi:hypothetical protein